MPDFHNLFILKYHSGNAFWILKNEIKNTIKSFDLVEKLVEWDFGFCPNWELLFKKNCYFKFKNTISHTTGGLSIRR